jgi:hypothetical protein
MMTEIDADRCAAPQTTRDLVPGGVAIKARFVVVSLFFYSHYYGCQVGSIIIIIIVVIIIVIIIISSSSISSSVMWVCQELFGHQAVGFV